MSNENFVNTVNITKEEFLNVIDEAENNKLSKNKNKKQGYELLGITG